VVAFGTTNWEVSTIAGLAGQNGATDGTNSSARFCYPQSVAVDSAGNVYVADRVNNTIRKVTRAGVVTTLAGLAGTTGSSDGTGSHALFWHPSGVAVDSSGNVYVADQANCTIRKVTAAGAVTTLAGSAGKSGSADGTGAAAQFSQPTSVAVDGAGNVYVADTDNNTIRKVTPTGVVTTMSGQPGVAGYIDGTGNNAQFYFPQGVAVDTSGNVYVADSYNSFIRKITPAGEVTTVAGASKSQGSVDGTGSAASFDQPTGVAAAPDGDVYVADTDNNTIRRVTSVGEVVTVAGLAGSVGSADGVGNEARFRQPRGVAVDAAGNVYVSDTGNSTIRLLTPAGVVSTIAGAVGVSGSADGTNASARFNAPWGLAVDGGGNLFVADSGNNTIRKIIPVSGNWIVKTIGGIPGKTGAGNGAGLTAEFYGPEGITVDGSGNVYVTDTLNLTIRLLKLIRPHLIIIPAIDYTNYTVTTIAGSPGVNGYQNGIGTNALFGGAAEFGYGPAALAVDSVGNLYVADGAYNEMIRKITPQVSSTATNWVVSTIGGSPGGQGSVDGAGSAAEFFDPQGITVDSNDDVYVADTRNNSIRQGVFLEYTPANTAPFTQPANTGTLVVTLLPAEANGQWRFPWELSWRNSGAAATGLVQGEYPIEFRTMPGYLILPLLGLVNGKTTVTNLVAVTAGQTTRVTNQYYPTVTTVDTNIGGSLTVNIGPSPPNGAGWRFLGDTTPFNPPDSSTNLPAGTYLIEFAPVSGFVTPSTLSVQVVAGPPMVLTITYLLSSAPPAEVLLPVPVPSGEISDLADYPFGFNGQLQTDAGYGSGVAVETNVVLTAAHLVFNDQTLSYVGQAYWFYGEEAGVFEPEPIAARGWYVLSGYAAQRTNDVLGGLGPDQSSPQSRNFDVAALYFESPAADGGYGGYLPSDATPNTWLTSKADKMLVGYPVDGSQYGVGNIVNGQMYEIGPQPFPLNEATDPIADQQVYTGSWLLSYPGNSGGPFYVQFDGYYYPAGVYLGTLFNGVSPYASAVRAIDSNVVTLITRAAALGDSGTNNSGGGVITIIPTGVSSSHPAYLIMSLGPPAAVAAGAAWEFVNQPAKDYLSASQSVQELSSSATVKLQFLPVAGWNLPANQTLTLTAGANTDTASYTLAVQWPAPAPITYGTPLGSQQLNATTVAPSGSYAYNPAGGTVLNTGARTLSVVFTPGDTADYGSATVSTNVSLAVLPAPLSVTASSVTWTQGEPFPSFTGAISGLVNGDNITVLCACAATSDSPAGTYPIVPSLVDPGDRQTNYTVTVVNGTLTITAPPTAPAIQSARKLGNNFVFTWTTAPNLPYQIQSTTSLTPANWMNLGGPITATNSTMSASLAITNVQQFYRVLLLP
jgi:hypothetical protein